MYINSKLCDRNMAIQFCALGGYSEIGMNMCAVRVRDEVVIFDMGFYIPDLVRIQEEEETFSFTREELIKAHVIPDDSVIATWRPLVKAIVLAHCHMDHTGAVPYLAGNYNCPIYGTPYTIEVLKTILREEKTQIKNPLKPLHPNSMVKISPTLTLELVNVTHSTPQTMIAALHTPEGVFLYGNDFKFDNHPVLGKGPNYKRLQELGDKGVLALVADALYSDVEMKTPPESVARDMLEDVLLHTDNRGKLVLVTTFASHIARLKSIIACGKKMGRKIVVLGRSMFKYISAAEAVKLVEFSKDVEMVKYGDQVRKKLKEIQKDPSKYLIICTGHQGEPGAILTRMGFNQIPFEFSAGDQVVFSCKTIPAPINIANREALEMRLKQKGVRLFKDVHVSGHIAREDHRDLLRMVKPKHLIPAQGDVQKLTALADFSHEEGYQIGETVHVLRDGQIISLQ